MAFDQKDAAHKASFVTFAYNMFGNGGVLQPPPDPGIAAAGFDLTHYLIARDFQDQKFYGYIAASKANPGDLLMAIRGTQNFAEWLLDFAALPVPFTPFPDAGLVALGFLSISDSFQLVNAKTGVASGLNDAVSALAATTPIQTFTMIGHSLGAALATLAAAELVLGNPGGVKDKLTCYTFASPRVGLLDFAATFNKSVKASFRIWNELDIVPELPTFPFIHVSGRGDKIEQTEDQLATLTITPPCEHHLTSYRWLLDPDEFNLDADCRNAPAEAPFGPADAAGVAESLDLAAPGVSKRPRQTAASQRAGAQRLRKALSGRS